MAATVSWPGFSFDDGDVGIALLRIADDGRLIERGRPAALRKPCTAAFGRADARTLALLAHVAAAHGQAGDVQREPARRREGLAPS
jgi:hypothetical protein